MLILGIDTSTSIGSVALRDESGVCGLLTVSVDLSHSEGLMPAVHALLERTHHAVDDITAVACVKGPGSYTGLRIGTATAQGLAYGNNVPGIAFSSLEVLAWSLPHSRYPICPIIPARKGWMYTQLFLYESGEPRAVTDELNITPDELVNHITQPTIFFGPGLPSFSQQLQGMLQDDCILIPGMFNLPRADCLTELAYHQLKAGGGMQPHEMQPHYLGPSQAEINWKRMKVKDSDK